ncbi:small VCP/p97-interacting protein-like [Watersipora subatra]|uniref:small VCP/p97-interacting protein-like n=1 Tax=Watersipora subatra TaxID=2589382 RepID=UPI00355B21D6
MGSLCCCVSGSAEPDVSIEVRRQQALEAAEKRQQTNQQRGVGQYSKIEARHKRLEKEEKKAILSGRANQPNSLSWQVG